MIHVRTITRLTSIPEICARTRSSAIARITRPFGVRARNRPIAPMATAATMIVTSWASDNRTSPITYTLKGSTSYERGCGPHTNRIAWRSTSATPIEARNKAMKPALRTRSGRQRTTSSPTESAAVAAMATSAATIIGRPSVTFTKKAMKAPKAIMSPKAKFTSRRIPYTSDTPTAAIAYTEPVTSPFTRSWRNTVRGL